MKISSPQRWQSWQSVVRPAENILPVNLSSNFLMNHQGLYAVDHQLAASGGIRVLPLTSPPSLALLWISQCLRLAGDILIVELYFLQW